MISCSVSSCPVGKRHDHAGTVYKKKLSLKFGHYLTSQCPIVSCGKRCRLVHPEFRGDPIKDRLMSRMLLHVICRRHLYQLCWQPSSSPL